MILAELLSDSAEWIVQYHEHNSLLVNHPEEDLSEEERKAAWEEYEREKQGLYTYSTDGYHNSLLTSQSHTSSLQSRWLFSGSVVGYFLAQFHVRM